jgi:hypothetical protein
MAPRTRKPTAPEWSDIVVGCLTPRNAHQFRAWLHDNGVDARSTPEGRNVYVPWRGDPRFLTELFEWAVKLGHAADSTAATAMATRLREVERRAGK